MSITRKLLKGMGLTEEQQETILEAHMDTVNQLKESRDKFKVDADKLAEVQKQLDDLQKQGDGGYKEKYEKVKGEFDKYKDEVSEKETRNAKESALRAIMKDVGISEKRIDSVLKVYDVDGVDVDENGAAKDPEKLKESIKADWGDFIVTTTTEGAHTATPPANNGGTKLTKADIYKKDDKGRYVMSTTERQKALAENKIT